MKYNVISADSHIIGVNTIMWSNDYPHGDSTWPYSQGILAQHFAGVLEDEKRKMVCVRERCQSLPVRLLAGC